MDITFLHPVLLQVAATATNAANAVVSGQIDTSGVVVSGAAAGWARTGRDFVIGAWGGDVNRPAPRGIALVAILLCGIGGAALALLALHVDIMSHLGDIIGLGATSAAQAQGQHGIGQQVQASEPAIKAAVVPNLEPVSPAVAAAVVAPLAPTTADTNLPPGALGGSESGPLSAAMSPQAATQSSIPTPDASAVRIPLVVGVGSIPPATPSVPPDAPQSPQRPIAPLVPSVSDPNVAQPLQNSEGADISAIFDPAWQQASIPRVLLLAAVLAESGLNPKAERWGRQTAAAQGCIAVGDMDTLQTIIDSAWMDISFGYSQRIVGYHWAGDHSKTTRNCLAVRDAVFNDPGRDLQDMATMLANCLQQARAGDLSPVGGDELLGALAVYNGGHLYPAGDPWWSEWAGNIASYRAMLTRLRATS